MGRDISQRQTRACPGVSSPAAPSPHSPPAFFPSLDAFGRSRDVFLAGVMMTDILNLKFWGGAFYCV